MGTQAGPPPESSEIELLLQVQSHSPRKDVCVCVCGGGGAWKHELVLLLNLQRSSYRSSRLCCYFIFKFSLTVQQGGKLVHLLHIELPL